MATSLAEGGEQGKSGEEVSPSSPSHLYSTLSALGIPLQVSPYVDNVDDRNNLPGIFCKNLFLKDRKGQFYLIVVPEDRNVDLKKLKVNLRAHRNFSFVVEEELYSVLGVRAGGVTPFGLLNDTRHVVRVVVDQRLALTDTSLNFHPLDPDKTFLISFQNLNLFITKCCGHEVEVVNMES